MCTALIEHTGPTENEVKTQLADEEDRVSAIENTAFLHAITPSGMLALLLDIEDLQ